jgi:hypothetical protein
MPILITNKEFTDAWGNVTPFYRSNAGDKLTLKLTIRSSIVLISSANPIIFNPISYELTSGGTSFESEGFRTGDTVSCLITDQFGTGVTLWTATVDYVNGNVLKIDTMPAVPDATLQQVFRIQVTGRNRQSIECRLNHVDNSIPGNDFSLIDGEATRFKFSSIDTISVGATQNAVIVGNQSGQYLESASLKRIADINANEFQYELSVVFVNSGIYDQSWFDSSDCLKVILKMLWSSIEDEPFAQTQLIYNDSANTGWFDEAHNSDEINGVMVQGVSEIDYTVNTSFQIIVDGEITELGIGASYIPLSDSQYKNKIFRQGNYGMLTPTSDLSVTTYTSQQNPETFASYEIQVTNITTIGTTTTIIDAVFIPNPDFTTMMDSLEEGNRTFYLWVKCGNLNLRAFNGQLTTSPPVGGELVMHTSKAFYDHAENTNDGVSNITYNRFDTEDDLAYFGKFLLDKNGNFSSFRVRIEAFNTVTDEDFTLKETLFSFGSTQIDSNGIYLVDQTITVEPQLPTTSVKRDAILKRDSTIDSLTQFGLSIYYPVVLDWKYWIEQLNASVDFYPNQNKNWQQYSGSGDWVVRMELELIQDGLAFTHSDQMAILGYDAKAQVVSSIQYIRELDSSVVNGLIFGEIMRIKSTHLNMLGSWGSDTWGMLTIEPKENSPRWISSTVIDFDNNSNNPLYPIPGETKALLTLSANIANIECLCDTTKLSGTIESITAKIKDSGEPEPPLFKTMAPDDMVKTMAPDDTIKTLA